MPNETFLEVLRSLARDDLETTQLGGRFFRDFIRKHEEDTLALRLITSLQIGEAVPRYANDRLFQED